MRSRDTENGARLSKMIAVVRLEEYAVRAAGEPQLPQTRARLNPPDHANPINSGSLGAPNVTRWLSR